MAIITTKKYKCRVCGTITEQSTNHYGSTYSFGHFNCCPKCPPWRKYSEYGGSTIWDCIDKPITEEVKNFHIQWSKTFRSIKE